MLTSSTVTPLQCWRRENIAGSRLANSFVSFEMIIIGCLLVTLVASGGSFSFVIFYVVWELKKNDKFCRKRTVRSHFLVVFWLHPMLANLS